MKTERDHDTDGVLTGYDPDLKLRPSKAIPYLGWLERFQGLRNH